MGSERISQAAYSKIWVTVGPRGVELFAFKVKPRGVHRAKLRAHGMCTKESPLCGGLNLRSHGSIAAAVFKLSPTSPFQHPTYPGRTCVEPVGNRIFDRTHVMSILFRAPSTRMSAGSTPSDSMPKWEVLARGPRKHNGKKILPNTSCVYMC